MRNLSLRLLLLASSLLAGIASASAADAPPLKNGVSIHGPLTWGKTNADRSEYAPDIYDDAKYDLPAALLPQVKQAGFDFIRLTVDPGPFLAGGQRDKLDQRLLDMVKQIRQQKLDILVDFHPIGMVKTYSPSRLLSDELFPSYVELIRHSAQLLAKVDSGHIAIETMNEPPIGYDPASAARWQHISEQLYNAVHDVAPSLPVVVTGGRSGSFQGLIALDPTPFDSETRYSFHYYLPYAFALQGASNYFYPLPYPASPDQFAANWQRIQPVLAAKMDEKQQAAMEKILQDYFNGKGTHAAITADFDQVAQWAQAHHIPPSHIFLGEFGVTQQGPHTKGALPEDRARWLTDVREEAEKHGFHWSMWVLTGQSADGMTLTSPTDPSHLDPLTLKALGK